MALVTPTIIPLHISPEQILEAMKLESQQDTMIPDWHMRLSVATRYLLLHLQHKHFIKHDNVVNLLR